jgi:YVTN family beta-propeller protein
MKMVSVGNGPTGIAFGSGSVWVANSLGGTVSRLNPATDEVTATIEVGEGPTDVDADSDAVWVAAERARSIVQIDASTNRVVRTIELVNRPKTLAAAGDKVWLAVQPSGAGHRGGRLVVANPALITSIDPGIGGNAALDLTSDGLVAPAHRDGVAGTQLVPDLAAAPPLVTAGRTAYAFQLRRGIRYSSGAVVKSSDFRRALERVFGLRSFASTLFRSLRGANACLRMPKRCDLSQGVRTNDATGAIVFRLARPDGEFLSSLETLAPVPPGTPDWEVGVRTVPSTGPYMIERYVPRRVVTLVRNPYFRVWSEVARPDGFADEIQFRLRLRGEDAVKAVESGRADFSFGVPASMLEEVETRYRSQLHLNPAPGTMFFVFLNTRLAPFDDVRVRRAVNYAVDRAAVARALGGTNAAQPLCQIRPPSVAGYRPYCPYTVDPTGGQWKAPDLARARRLVAASGTKGMKVTLWAWAENIQPAAREVVSALNRLGYRATLRRVDTIDHYFPEVLDEKTRAQAGMFGWIGASGQLPSYVLPSSLTCASIRAPNNNPSFFCDPKIDEQIRHALSVQATEPTGAVALWARIERDIVDLAPWVPLFTPKRAQFVSARVGNYQYNPATGAGVLLDQLWVR